MILNRIILIYRIAFDGLPRFSHVLPQKTGNFRSLLPVNQLTWEKQKSFTCQTFTLVHDTKNRLSISLIISD